MGLNKDLQKDALGGLAEGDKAKEGWWSGITICMGKEYLFVGKN